jgi:hypothetical protein
MAGLGVTGSNNFGGGSAETCIAYCLFRGFLYAGLQYRWKKVYFLFVHIKIKINIRNK